MKSKRASYQQQPEPPAALLTLRNPEDLRREMQQVQLAIARRAYELFQARGGEHGHDWEDWFRAKSELLRPVSFSMAESKDRISVRADVVGFDETELKVSIEPHCITILGQKKTSGMKDEAKTIEQTGSHPDQILEVIDLATEVTPKRAVVELQDGVLKFELPTAATNEVAVAPAA
jgi:HSP20 family molecular chaperone IbpA